MGDAKDILAESPSLSKIIFRRFWSKWYNKLLLGLLSIMVFITIFADFLANNRPLYCVHQGETHFPVYLEYKQWIFDTPRPDAFLNDDWKSVDYEKAIWPLVAYKSGELDIDNMGFVAPGKGKKSSDNWKPHLLGTDRKGRDVASGMIHGTRVALLIGLIAMFIAFIIGVLLGSMAGYYGDNGIHVSRVRVILNVIAIPWVYFWAYYVRRFALADAAANGPFFFLGELFISLVILFLVFGVAHLLASIIERIPRLGNKKPFPLDSLIMRGIEVVSTMPTIVLVLAVVSIVSQSLFWVMATIGLVGWTGIARLIRGELMRIRELGYIEASRALGFSEIRIMWRHAIPNALGPVLIHTAFGIAAAVLIEAFLSFLGIGSSADMMTWGKLLKQAKGEMEAWWVALFPGGAIFVTVTLFNLIGQGIMSAMNPDEG